MDSSRLEAFSVGVMAVIITRMVLGLKAPAGASLHDLRTLLPNFLIDALSFQMLGASWTNHHHVRKGAKTSSAGGQKR
jgi:TMEM175 potassium channel family protein